MAKQHPKPSKKGTSQATSSQPGPTVVDPNPELRALRETLEKGTREVERAVSSAVTQALRGQLKEELSKHLDELVASRVSQVEHGLDSREARIEATLTDVQQKLGEATARLSVVSEETLGERIRGAVLAATKDAAEDIYQREFQRRVKDLESLFDDVEDQFSQVQAYVKQFGPGGLPVLAQRLETEAQQRQDLEEQLHTARDEIKALRSIIDKLEGDRRRWKAADGVDPETLDRKLEALVAREHDLAEREALAARNQRLEGELESARKELREWTERDLAVRQDQADRAALQQAIEEREAADEARERAEYHRGKEKGRAERLKGRVRELEALFEERKADIEAAEKRDERLEQLEQSLAEARELHEDARREIRGLEDQITRLRVEKQELRIELGEVQERADDARSAARLELAQEHAEEHTRRKGELEQWAEAEAATRAAAWKARAEKAEEQLGESLEALEQVRADHADEKAHRSRLESSQKALEESVAERKALLDQTFQELLDKARLDLESQRIRVLDEARAQGEREAAELEAEGDRLDALVNEKHETLQQRLRELAELDGRKGELQAQVEGLEGRIDELRLRAVDDEERLAALHSPVFAADSLPQLDTSAPSEKKWLSDLGRQIADAGFTFHPRLLRAFHTSLKIADQAPLAVLAGISGTGKSELPRLYADLGGLPFLELAVQPRWDSPDDLFGFFNYTDGRLKAEPLSRLLHQLSRDDDPLRSGPVVVLLDEMNIARVEYYFSELLSKLEARRTYLRTGTRDARDRASIRLAAGTGKQDILLYPDERVLFVGTMNEDESTLTLSDKVLDRSCVLTFPAPRSMRLHEQGQVSRRAKRLSWETWVSWKDQDLPADKDEELNQVNALMERVGRPFGHRLFRAIHAYITAYPRVDGDWQDQAWSDQLAMKILPRLRGLECGDRTVAAVLDDLRRHIPSELEVGFNQARQGEFFAWAGAADLYRVEATR